MKLFDKVAIVGTGLIGGSIALAIKKHHLANQIIGVSRHRNSILLAKSNHVIDIGSRDIRIIKQADLVILAMPVKAIIKLAPRIAKNIKKNCIVTDVGSTKKEIVLSLSTVFKNFIGSHPLAGSEKRGVKNACPNLFINSTCVLTPNKNTNPLVLNRIKKLWQKLGAKIVLLDPRAHDKALAFVSHLPHIIAFSLINSIPLQHLNLASSGLKDTTRIAASDSQLWSDVFLSNRKFILSSLETFQKELGILKKALQKKNISLINKTLRKARVKRETLK